MSRIKLADISALTLYQDEVTSSRRGKPIPQLVCKGKPCKLFTPEVVRCVNVGGEGTDVDWKVRTYFSLCVTGSYLHDAASAKRIFLSPCDWDVSRCRARGGRARETLMS